MSSRNRAVRSGFHLREVAVHTTSERNLPQGVSFMKRVFPFLALLLAGTPTWADEPKKLIDLPYGKHPRQVLDFYQARSDKPTPVVFYIHGGGWRGGDKNSVGNVKPYLDAGISVVPLNYRYVKNGVEAKGEPPVKAPLSDPPPAPH